MGNNLDSLLHWEALLKKVLWTQIGQLSNQRILDFGSGIGVTADHYAEGNDVVAVEPSEESVQKRWDDHPYCQIVGSTDALRQILDESFDVIFCHNVLEYAPDREEILREFYRLLKPQGILSLVKHNRPGRVMQMVVLLNDFEKADALLNGEDGYSADYGTIHYYEDEDVMEWCDGFCIRETYGIRTFWDLQQNQQCHKDAEWQEKMVAAELRVSRLQPYRDVAFFHHLILEKKQ